MKKYLNYGMIVMAVMAMMTACSDNDGVEDIQNPEPQPPTPVVSLLTAEEQAALPAINDAQLDFFEAVFKTAKPSENVLCSPLSAQVLLSMLANVVEPTAAEEIFTALGCGNQELLNSMNVKLMGAMKKASPVTFKPANALWYDTQYTLSDAGKDLISGSYAPEVFARDFQAGGIADEINKWCAERTDNLIPKILDEDPRVFALLNAIYFYGPWANEFDVKKTKEQEFYGENGTTMVNMMSMEHAAGVFIDPETLMSTGVELKCKGGQFAVDYLLPNQGQSLDEFLTAENIQNAFNWLGSDKVYYAIPKMKLTPDKIDLKEALAAMGIKAVYDERAVKMFTQTCKLKEVLQKSAVEIDEKGAKAAVVSIGTGLDVSAGVVPVIIDRPFVMLIREVSTGTILFAGAVRNL